MIRRSLVRLGLVFVLVWAGLFLWGSGFAGCVAPQQSYSVKGAFPNLVFENPVGIYDDGSGRLFVVEQRGIIRVFENSADVAVSGVFLDISDRVLFGGEQGLLGLAFPDDFAASGVFYVNYVADNPRRTVIARYAVLQGNPNLADKGSEFVLLEVLQPFSNHKGGQICFGPDGFLYIGLGDGGSGGDPLGNGQNLSSLLGKILRIDVSLPGGYVVPGDNPFVGNALGYREEIFAYGFRNPWRFSFDSVSGQLWVGDVGQNRVEEIDVVLKGLNYGWNRMEGSLCYPAGSSCNREGLVLPVWEYDRSLGYSVTGGFIYRGSVLDELFGSYVYGDYGSGRIWALQVDSGVAANFELVDTGLSIASFGVDRAGELYVCAFDDRIYQLQVLDFAGPVIGVPWQVSLEPSPGQQVAVFVNVTDEVSGVREVFLSFSSDGVWTDLSMSRVGGDTFAVNIAGMPFQTSVRYKITAVDNSGNISFNDNLGVLFAYEVIPEFASLPILALVMLITTLVVAALFCRKRLS